MSEEDYKAVGAIKNQWIETKDEYLDMALNVIDNLKIKNKQLEEIIGKVSEYLTSYSSIHTIRFGTEEDSLNDIELNKELDTKTLTEMTNRYLMVHDKLLKILNKVGDDNEQ